MASANASAPRVISSRLTKAALRATSAPHAPASTRIRRRIARTSRCALDIALLQPEFPDCRHTTIGQSGTHSGEREPATQRHLALRDVRSGRYGVTLVTGAGTESRRAVTPGRAPRC